MFSELHELIYNALLSTLGYFILSLVPWQFYEYDSPPYMYICVRFRLADARGLEPVIHSDAVLSIPLR